MNCEHFKELILSDYIDNELRSEQEGAIKLHIKECSSCAKLYQDISELSEGSFKALERKRVPQIVWQNIERSLDESSPTESDQMGAVDRMKGFLGGLLNLPRPALVFSSLALIVLMATTLLYLPNQNGNPVSVSNSEKQDVILFLVSEYNNFESSSIDENGSMLEEIFL